MKKTFKPLKKLVALILSALMITSVPAFQLSAFAAETENAEVGATSGTTGNCTWTVDNGVLTISGNGAMGGYDSSYAPWKSLQITKAVINNGVTNIGEGAFAWCSKLSSITIPNSVTVIENQAFNFCPGLTSITLPNNLKSIGDEAFLICSSLESVTIPGSVTSLGEYAFGSCSKLKSVTISEGVTSIGDYAFSNCKALESIIFPESVTDFGSGVFYSVSSNFTIYGKAGSAAEAYAADYRHKFDTIKTVVASGTTGDCTWTLTDDGTLTISGNGAMRDYIGYIEDYPLDWFMTDDDDGVDTTQVPWKHKNITKVVIKEGVTRIGAHSFYKCNNLSEVVIPNSLTSIGMDAFEYCSSLTDVILPDNLTEIGSGAFSRCSSLTSVNIPENITKLYSYMFYDCQSLVNITIPESITELDTYAFYGCTSLASVNIPGGVTKICDGVFKNCKNLTEVSIPDNVTSIGYEAFSGCESLESIAIPKSVTSISASAFNNDDNLTMYGRAGSYAETYANENNIPFVADINSGTTGDCTWSIDINGVLTISGNGAMESYYPASHPICVLPPDDDEDYEPS